MIKLRSEDLAHPVPFALLATALGGRPWAPTSPSGCASQSEDKLSEIRGSRHPVSSPQGSRTSRRPKPTLTALGRQSRANTGPNDCAWPSRDGLSEIRGSLVSHDLAQQTGVKGAKSARASYNTRRTRVHVSRGGDTHHSSTTSHHVPIAAGEVTTHAGSWPRGRTCPSGLLYIQSGTAVACLRRTRVMGGMSP